MTESDKKQNKARTAITIDRDLWDEAKRCAAGCVPKKLSFSALVERALRHYLDSKEG